MATLLRPEGWTETASALRKAREDRGLTLADVAARTRIATRHLAAIEDSHFDSFRAPIYAVGFAKSFARSVGLEERLVAAAVKAGIVETTPVPVDEVATPRPRHFALWNAATAAVGSLALLVLILAG